MPPSLCLRSLSQLSLNRTVHASPMSRTLHAPHMACFSTTTARLAKAGMAAPPKRGTKTLNIKKGRKAPGSDTGKRPAQGERKAMRKRIVLTNDNALEVPGLLDLTKANVLSDANAAKVMGFPEQVVDVLRTMDAFRPSQGWNLFRRPATLMRKETVQLAGLMKDAEKSAKTIRRVLTGERMSGKSTLLLQGLAMANLRDWVVISIPEGKDLVNGYTSYSPDFDSNPLQYTQEDYIVNLLRQILKVNGPVFEKITVTPNPTLQITVTPSRTLSLPANHNLKQLLELGIANKDAAWAVFLALWQELSQPGRPPIMFAIDGLSHIMNESAYMSAEMKPIHAHDLTLIRFFVDLLSGKTSLANGGIVLAATSQSNARKSVSMDHSIQVAEALRTTPDKLPSWNPYKKVDHRVVESLKDLQDPKKPGLDIIQVGGLSKDEARSIIEYYAESGLVRHTIDEKFVSEKWSLAGMGNAGELERATVRLRL